MQNVIVTGASAGVGRAIAAAFADEGATVGLVARNAPRLEAAVSDMQARGAQAMALPLDVADAAALDEAARRFEDAFGPIDVWVNAAMLTVLAPVSRMEADEYRRVHEVTFLGTVHGTQTALRQMRARDRGVIVQVGSALSYRSVPLQSAYCAAKSAVVGFTDSLRSELLHDKSGIEITVVHLPAVNTPQFDWARNKLGERAQPVPPIFDPALVARQVVRAAHAPRREYWLGFPAVKAIASQMFAPWLGDRMMASVGYSDQTTGEPLPEDRPDNLWQSVDGDWAAEGRFGDVTETRMPALWSPAMRAGVAVAMGVGALGVAFIAGLWLG